MLENHPIKTTPNPPLLEEITDPPQKLYIRGKFPGENYKYLCVVGSRKYTPYGKDACDKLLGGLRGYPIVIVSGLAIGIDTIAHKTALATGLKTIAIPGSGLDEKVLYPRTNVALAREILQNGGCLLSEYEPDFSATVWSFPKRNRIMAGLSHATLIIEAAEKSGTLITARLATEYNRDVLAVPGSIFSASSYGSHMLIKLGATPTMTSEDILTALGIKSEEKDVKNNLSKEEEKVLAILETPLPKDVLIRKLNMKTSQANILLSAMELRGIIAEQFGEVRIK